MVDPNQIARQLTRALKRDAAQLVYRVLAPNQFTVRLPKLFMDQWSFLLDQLNRELTEHLEKQARRLGLDLLPGPMSVEFVGDPTLGRGSMRVETAFNKPKPQPPKLLAMTGRDQGRSFPLIRPVSIIGRGPVDVALDPEEETVSRRHASIQGNIQGNIIVPDESFVIQDLGSASGTFVNARPVTQGPLFPGDEISVGGVVLSFVAGNETEKDHG